MQKNQKSEFSIMRIVFAVAILLVSALILLIIYFAILGPYLEHRSINNKYKDIKLSTSMSLVSRSDYTNRFFSDNVTDNKYTYTARGLASKVAADIKTSMTRAGYVLSDEDDQYGGDSISLDFQKQLYVSVLIKGTDNPTIYINASQQYCC